VRAATPTLHVNRQRRPPAPGPTAVATFVARAPDANAAASLG
jgi:hypothetical protein